MGGRSLTRLRYIHAFVDRHGSPRYYFRRHGKRTHLPGIPGSPEFMSVYSALMAVPQAAPIVRAKVAPGSFAALASVYYGSPQYAQLSASSQRNYRRVIDGFLVSHGHRRVDEMRREHVDAIIGKLANKPGAAIILLKRIRTLNKYAIALHWREGDPTLGVKGFRSKEIHTWTESEIEQFEKMEIRLARKISICALALHRPAWLRRSPYGVDRHRGRYDPGGTAKTAG